HRAAENVLLLRPQAENTWNGLFPGRNSTCLFQVAVRWDDCRNVRVSESVWGLLSRRDYLSETIAFYWNRSVSPIYKFCSRPFGWVKNFCSINLLFVPLHTHNVIDDDFFISSRIGSRAFI
ncbi:hypothetical protein E4T56_gene1888, partial [Termitomyces sp. T112]